jgi:hypothetical protein
VKSCTSIGRRLAVTERSESSQLALHAAASYTLWSIGKSTAQADDDPPVLGEV